MTAQPGPATPPADGLVQEYVPAWGHHAYHVSEVDALVRSLRERLEDAERERDEYYEAWSSAAERAAKNGARADEHDRQSVASQRATDRATRDGRALLDRLRIEPEVVEVARRAGAGEEIDLPLTESVGGVIQRQAATLAAVRTVLDVEQQRADDLYQRSLAQSRGYSMGDAVRDRARIARIRAALETGGLPVLIAEAEAAQRQRETLARVEELADRDDYHEDWCNRAHGDCCGSECDCLNSQLRAALAGPGPTS